MSSKPSDPHTTDADADQHAPPPLADEPSSSRFGARHVVMLLLAALFGGGAGAVIANRYYGIMPRPEMSAKYYQESEEKWATLDFSPDVVAEKKWADSVIVSRNTGLALGIIGAILGSLFGAIVGAARKSPQALVRGLLGGIVLGGLFGIAAGYAGGKLHMLLEDFQVDIRRPGDLNGAWLRRMYSAIGLHASEWCVAALGLALSVGLAAGLGVKSLKRVAAYLLGGAVFASLAYTPLAAWLFPSLKSEVPFPEGTWNRLMFTLLPSILMALMLGKALRAPGVGVQPSGGASQAEA